MNVLPLDRQIDIINGLCNGMSLRACSRVFNTHRTAIQNLLVRVGRNCDDLMTQNMKGLDLRSLEMDELWTFCRKKERMLTKAEKKRSDLGDQYLFFAIDRETKVIPAWALGKRTGSTALEFLGRLSLTLNGTIPQVTTDAWAGYTDAITFMFGRDVNYAQLTKTYEAENPGPGRYAPPKVSEVVSTVISGEPDPKFVCTSIVERSNLTVRTMQRRFTRLALGFSKKLENLKAAVALNFAYYNFCWIPRTLRVTPAMAAGATDRLWDVADLLSAQEGSC
jgi:IS1 family transposase